MLAGRDVARKFAVGDFATSRFFKFPAPGVRMRPIPITYPVEYGTECVIEISNRDRTGRVEWRSMRIRNVLTRQVDTANFTFKHLVGEDFMPTVNENVKIYDNGTLIFQGVIVGIKKEMFSPQLVKIDIEAVDYTRELDARRVQEAYESKTAEYIIRDIIRRYAPQFTFANVYAPVTINYVQFTYQTVSECLQELADMTGYDFYIDQYKDLHFRLASNDQAPFDLLDTNGSYVAGSLQFEEDIKQLRNEIFLRGGDERGPSSTYSKIADGTQTVFSTGYHFETIPAVTVASVAKTIGYYGRDDAASYDCLWDATNDFIVFTAPPASLAQVDVTGTPLIPILLRLPERTSVALYGTRQMVIIDKTITTRAGARQRALAELLRYAESLVSASFKTRTTGLKAGQVIDVDSDTFEVEGQYVVTEVSIKPFTPTTMEYDITLVSTKIMDIVDLLAKMLRGKLKEQDYDPQEVFDPAEVVFEDMVMTDVVTTQVGADITVTETMTCADVVTVQALDFGITYVVGPWIPIGGDNRRALNVDIGQVS